MTEVKIERLVYGTERWEEAIEFAASCSWSAGGHMAYLLRENRFSDWECAFAAIEQNRIVGYCTFLKEDYYPENRYSPWISSIFVDEAARGKRISHELIKAASAYAEERGFSKVYIPSDMEGFYEKCGFQPIDKLRNYAGAMDTIYMRRIGKEQE